MLDVMYEPTLPAKIIEQKVGANSKIIDLFAAKPIKDLGITIYTYANDSNRVSIHQEDFTDYLGENK